VICEGRPVGEISFRGYSTNERISSLNLKIAAWERGHGYARQALRRLLRFYFEELACVALTNDVALDNAAGQSLLLSEGFAHDPEITEVCQLVLTKTHWAVLNNTDEDNNTAQQPHAADLATLGR
jgi:RimJ/RimL family protein N-acetyltransferase